MTIAFVTSALYPAISPSDQLCAQILQEKGHCVDSAVWSDTHIVWEIFDLIIFRSCWDYYTRLDDFMVFLHKLKKLPKRVYNPIDMILWNHHKKYLLDLANRSIEIPKTVILSQGQDVTNLSTRLRAEGWPVNWQNLVVKPCISASGTDVVQVTRDQVEQGNLVLKEMLKKSDSMLQEYIPEVVTEGEYSYVFFNGVFSHAILKQVNTDSNADEFRVNSQYKGRNTYITGNPIMRKGAQQVIDTLTTMFNEPPLYARIDGVNRNGHFILMEAELIEPSLFLPLYPEGAQQFADAINGKINKR